MPNHFQKKSFTLIEMLVVVVIIGILAGVLVPRLVGAKERANDSARIVKVSQISSAVELYAQEQGSKYPLAVLTGAPGISIATPIVTNAISPYLTNIPTDPGKGTVAISGALGNIQVTGDSFAYWTNKGGTVFAITALMESKKGNTTNATQIIDSDKQGSYQKVGRGLTTTIVPGGGTPTVGITQAGTDLVIYDGSNSYTIMDRNLGATEAGTGINSYGAFYQRGNNFPFSNTGAVSPSSTIQVDASAYGPDNPYSSGTFIIHTQWDSSNNTNLWGENDNTNLARKGPCPDGYHIPSDEERVGLITARRNIYTDLNNGNLLRDTVFLPMPGYRDNNSSIIKPGVAASYRTSSTYGVYSRSLYFYSTRINPLDYYYRSGASPIRCFKN